MLNGMMTLVTLVGIYASLKNDTFQYDKYGGWTGLSSKATGFFYTEKINGIWWLIDPDGNAFISKGVNHISFTGDNSPALGYSPYGRATEEKYGNIQNWAEASIKRLKGWNFNTVGAWSSNETFDKGMPYTVIMGMGAAARASWLEGTFTDVFSPEFRDIAEDRAKRVCEPIADDPFLVGYFLDNELRWGPDWRSNKTLFDDFLSMPENAHGKKALVNMLKEMYGDIGKLNSLWNISLHSFDDLLRIKNLPELGDGMISAQQELETRLKQRVTIPKEAALLYLNQFYGSLDKVNEAFNTNAHSYEELLTPHFLSSL
ncbi:hypothetical protein FJZ33_10900, partial [Candidatus Poribacteria bacterium]|nr:hypothetical protein [Candidatus Poribacteria bacterium]